MTKNETRLNRFFEELVPLSGKAETRAGELVRAAVRIDYRFFNDGDQIGKGYGNETCNAAARFLMKHADETTAAIVKALWEVSSDQAYETLLDIMIQLVCDYIDNHPELRTMETEDMFDYSKPEDRIYYEDEDDYDCFGEEEDEDDQ